MKYVISVGAGKNQLPFIKTLRRRNFRVIGFDLDNSAPGKRLCNVFKNVSTHDFNSALNWLNSLDVTFEAIGCFSCAQAVLTQHKLASYFNLPTKIDPSLIEKTLDKSIMRDHLGRIGSGKLEEFYDFNIFLRYIEKGNINSKEFIIKPRNGICSRGVIKLSIEDIYCHVKAGDNLKGIIIQPYLTGDEFRVIAFCQKGQLKSLQLIKKENLSATFFTSRFLPVYEINDEFFALVKRCIEYFNLKDCLLKMDVISSKDGCDILELHFEIPGDYFEAYLSQLFYKYDYINNYINFILEEEVSPCTDIGQYSCFDYLYNLQDDVLRVDYKKIRKVLDKYLGDYVIIETKKNGDLITYPRSNMDNFCGIVHKRNDISNKELNQLVNHYLRNYE